MRRPKSRRSTAFSRGCREERAGRHDDARLQALRLDRMLDAMSVRRQTFEHPFETLKGWMGATHFLTRSLDKVRTEMSPPRPGLQPQANDQDLRCVTADGVDQNLIALLKTHAPIV